MSAAIKNAIRAARRVARLGDAPRCRYCGESNPARLMVPKGKQGGHHRTFRERDPDYNEVICGSCQLEIHSRLAEEGIGPKRELDVSSLNANRLRAMAVSRRMEADYAMRDAEHFDKWASELETKQTNRGDSDA